MLVLFNGELTVHESKGTPQSHTVWVTNGGEDRAQKQSLRATEKFEGRGYEMWVPPTEVEVVPDFDPNDVQCVSVTMEFAALRSKDMTTA